MQLQTRLAPNILLSWKSGMHKILIFLFNPYKHFADPTSVVEILLISMFSFSYNDLTIAMTVCSRIACYIFAARVSLLFNSLRPRQNGRHFPDDIFKCIFLFENAWIWIKISLKFVPRVRINNIPALFQIMAWCRIGDKPLSEPMMVNLLTHICVTRPQWVKSMYTSALTFITTILLFTIYCVFFSV